MPRSRRSWGAGLAVGLVLATTACPQENVLPPTRPGDALAAEAPGPAERLRLPPGQEIVQLFPALRNDTDEPLEITKLRAMPGRGVPEAAQIVQISLMSTESPHEPGVYVTFPPITRSGDRCVRAGVRAPRGVTIEPGEDITVLVWLRSIDEGTAMVTGLRANYVHAETSYVQEIAFSEPIVLRIDLDEKVVEPSRDERACASEARFLPGSVRY
jgi:hypothetical protein